MTKYIVRVERKRTQTYFLEYIIESDSEPTLDDVMEDLPVEEELGDEDETNEVYDIEEVKEE